MQAKLFYETQSDGAIPLYLMSQSQREEESSMLTSAEQNCLALHQFKGKIGDSCFIQNADGLIDKAYIGTGDGNYVQALANAALVLPPNIYQVQGRCPQEATMNWALAQYRFEAYKKYEMRPRILVVHPDDLNDLLALTQAQFLVRDLVNKPTSDLGPKELADVVEQLAQTYQGNFKQWVGDELLNNNFPAIHAVGRASKSAPRLLSLTWGDEKNPRITLVGKGVCFDSGGLDINLPLACGS